MKKSLLISCLLFSLSLKSAEIPLHIKTLLTGLIDKKPRSMTMLERRRYCLDGTIIPIFNVCNESLDQKIGSIITDAHQTMWGGVLSMASSEPENHIFLDGGITQYSAKIKIKEQSILACVAENNKIAIAWTYPSHTITNRYITFIDVDSVKQGKEIDLWASEFNKTAIELK